MARLFLVVGLLLAVAPARAAGGRAAFVVEGTVGPGWRVALGPNDRSPGFEALTGGGELLAGVGFGWVGVVAGGRLRVGQANHSLYLEVDCDLAAQFFLGERVRARLGAEGGWAHLRGAGSGSSLVGGFVEISFDLVSFSGGRWALAVSVRLDLDAFLTDDQLFPKSSGALGAGIGVRY